MNRNPLMQRLWEKIKEIKTKNDSAAHDLLRTNIKSLKTTTLVMLLIFAIEFIVFWNMETTSPVESRWRSGILASHGSLFIIMLCLRIILAIQGRWNEHIWFLQGIQWAVLLSVLGGGIAFVTFDQLVTTSITPFLLVCIATSIFILLRPLHYLLLYPAVFFVYTRVIGTTQTDPAVLLSNRINGITAVMIAIALSMLLWRNAVQNTLQGKQLDQQQNELEEKNRMLEKMAYYDMLTGLINRRMFGVMLKKEMANLRRNHSPASLLLIDLDDFKQVNDTYGHPAGDLVLKQASELIVHGLREGDLVVRWGGEEILCVLINTDLNGAAKAAEKLGNLIASSHFGSPATIQLTVSIGVAALECSEEKRFEQCYQNVDQALYQAKQAGKNCCKTYDHRLKASV